jgi:hypothetical protein
MKWDDYDSFRELLGGLKGGNVFVSSIMHVDTYHSKDDSYYCDPHYYSVKHFCNNHSRVEDKMLFFLFSRNILLILKITKLSHT